MASQGSPRLSLVVPTMGKPDGILRMLASIIDHAPPSLLETTELVVFLNADPETPINISGIEAYLDANQFRFCSVLFNRAEKFYLTAEESAYAAAVYATGDYLWLVGDKRIFLPEGLMQLAQFMENLPTPCAYFNSLWHDSDGYTNGHTSTFFSRSVTTIPYKTFVQGNGTNFMATNYGTWVFRRDFLDLEVWKHIIEQCGPHYSHVTVLLATMGQVEVTCHAVVLSILESKAYHHGDNSEFDRYTKLVGSYRYYIWTFGMVRQLGYLVGQGVYSYADIRRSMCSEGEILRRQVDEVYKHITSQIRLGWFDAKQRITLAEFNEIQSFLIKCCPERAIVNGLLRKLYEESLGTKTRSFLKYLQMVERAVNLDHCELRFSSLIVGQIGDIFIRLHPRGYILSKVRDNEDFLLAYKLADPPLKHKCWKIIDEKAFLSLKYDAQPARLSWLNPVQVSRPVHIETRIGRRIGSAVTRLYNLCGRLAVAAKMPKIFTSYLWRDLF